MSLPVKTHTQFCSQAGKQYQVNCPTCSAVEKVLDAARVLPADLFRCGGCGCWRIKGHGACHTCQIRFHRDSIKKLQARG